MNSEAIAAGRAEEHTHLMLLRDRDDLLHRHTVLRRACSEAALLLKKYVLYSVTQSAAGQAFCLLEDALAEDRDE